LEWEGMSRRRTIVLGCLAAGLVLRLAAGLWIARRAEARLPDSQLYKAYAAAIYHGRPYFDGKSYARRTPGYPAFTALCCYVAGVDPNPQRAEPGEIERVVAIGQALASLLTCWFAYRVAALLQEGPDSLPKGTAVATLVLTVLDPYAVVLSGLVLSETLFATLLMATVWVASKDATLAGRRWPARLGGITGLLAGFAVMVRPSGLLLAPIGAGLWVWLGSDRRRRARHVLGAAVGMLLVLTPWWYRNWRLFDAFVPTTLNVGESLYDGLNPEATGASNMEFLNTREQPAGELARDRYWRRKALDFVASHPGQSLRLAAVKFARFWSPWPNAERFRSPAVVVATTLATVPVWLLALAGAWANRQRIGVLALCLTPALYFCVLHMAFVSSVRYRAPAMPLFAVLAGAGLVLLWRWRFGSKQE
jgi:hypothetical protein